MKTNDKVKLAIAKDKTVISKPKKEKMSLKKRFVNYKGDNLAKDFSWDDKKGKEIW